MTDASGMPSAPTWRLIESDPAAGAWNLALDDAVFGSVRAGASPPTLRLYGWSPPALTIGYAQSRERDVDLEACRAQGVAVLRRVTGGRAVLHDDEVTYSVCCAGDRVLFGTGIGGSGARIAAALAAALAILGAPAPCVAGRGGRRGRGLPRSADCFVSEARHEVGIAGVKAVGSAQRRVGEAFLQHGSIPIGDPAASLARLLRSPRGTPARGRGLAFLLGRRPDRGEVAAALREGFAATWGVRFEPSGPSAAELRKARSLERSRYGSEPWNRGRSSPGRVALTGDYREP